MTSYQLNQEGEKLLGLKEYEEAIFKFDKAIEKNDPNMSRSQTKLNKARALIGLKRFDQAIDLLNSIEEGISLQGVNLQIGIAQSCLKNYPEAIAAFQREINLGSNFYSTQIELGRVFLLQGNYQQSLNWLNEGIEKFSTVKSIQTHGKLLKASCLFEMERYNDSLKILDQLINLEPKNEQIFAQYGQIYMKLEQFQKAYDNFTESIKIKPKKSTKHLQIDAMVQLKRYEEVIQMCIELLKDDQTNSSLYTNYSIALHFQNRLSDSLLVVEKAIEFDSNNVQAYNIKAQSLHRLNRFDEALEVILKAININPKYQLSYINQTQALIALKRYNEALEASNAALMNDSNSFIAFKLKCQVLVELNRSQEALDLCQQTVLFNGGHYLASTLKGDLLFRQQKFQKALEAYDSSIQINPNITETYSKKGLALIQLKKYQETIEISDKTLAIESECLEALKNKGKAYYFLKQYLNSKTVFLKTLEMYPNELDVLNSIALICRKQNQLMEALDYLNKAILIDSNFVIAIVSKSEIYRQLQQNRAARSEFEKVIQLINSGKSQGVTPSCLTQIKILLGFLDDLKEIVSSLRKNKTRILKDEQLIELKDNISALGTALNDFWYSKAIEFSDEIVNESPEQSEKSRFEEIFNMMKKQLLNFTGEIQRNDYEIDRINEALRKKRIEVIDEQEKSQKKIAISNEQKERVTQQQQQQYPLINDTELVRLALMKIEQKEKIILDYCKTFFWTSVSLITAYRLIKQDARETDYQDVKSYLEKNELLLTEGVLQCVRSISDKNVKNEEILLLRQNPLSGVAVICIDEIINSILTINSRAKHPREIVQDKLRQNKQVIQRKLNSDHGQATALAFIAIEMASVRDNELLYPPKSEGIKEFVSEKIEQVKKKGLQSIYIKGNNSRAIDAAIRDSIFIIVLFAIYGEQIAEINQPIHQQIIKLLSSNKVEEFIALQEKKKFEEPEEPKEPKQIEEPEELKKIEKPEIPEEKNKQNQARLTEKPKKGCDCKIF